MKLYLQSTRGYQVTEGMDQATVERLLTDLGGADIQYIDEFTYNTAIQRVR